MSLDDISLSPADVAAFDAAFASLEAESRADDPVGGIGDTLEDHLWSAQRLVYASVVANRYTAVPAAHGLGKSRGAADIALWWVNTKPGPFVITSAPTAAQVGAILWCELNAQHKTHKLPGRVTFSGYPELKMGGNLVGIGREPSDYDVDTFVGIHALNVSPSLMKRPVSRPVCGTRQTVC